MAGQIQLTFFLVIIVCTVHGTPLTVKQDNFNALSSIGEIRANLDKLIDDFLPSIHEFILKNGMDPLRLVDISEYILPSLPGKLKGNIDLKKGWMQNLSLIKRTEHVTAIYKNKRLTLDMNLGFDVMDVNYEYYFTYLIFKRQGDVYGRFFKLDVNVVLTIDLNEYRVILESIKFSDVGKYDIKFEGHLVDRILNILTKLITVVFQNRILKVVEEYAMFVFGTKIDEWNKIPLSNRTTMIDGWLNSVKN